MSPLFSGIHWLGVLAAAVASSVLGGVWFAVLFRKPYARALGKEQEPATRPTLLHLAGPFVCGLVTTVTTAILMGALRLDSLRDAMVLGALVGFGYLAATSVNTAINPNIPRPLLYGLVSGSYFVIASIVSAALVAALR